MLDGALRAQYTSHRAAIDSVVIMANTANAAEEAQARTTIAQRTLLLVGLGVSIVALVSCFGWWIMRGIVGPLARTVEVLEELTGRILKVADHLRTVISRSVVAGEVAA